MLGESIRRADDVETLARRPVLVERRLEGLHDGVDRLRRMQRIRNRAFDRFVVLRERTVLKRRERAKEATDAFRIHDEWTHVILRRRIHFEIGNVVAHPPSGLVPPDLTPFGVPRFAGRIARRAVVHDAPIGRPRPRPIRIDAEARWILGAATLGHRTGLGPRPGVEPIAAERCAVVFQRCEAWQLLSGLDCLTS